MPKLYTIGHSTRSLKEFIALLHTYNITLNQGYATAQFELGWFYANGRGVERSQTEAIDWYRKAARQGNENAKNALKKLGVGL